jgi:predicted CXXCH cytochrome family protein
MDGAVVDLGPAVPTGTVTFAEVGPGAWTAVISDGGASTAALPVVEVYGGHRTGAALAVDLAGTRRILPAVWALAGQGLSARQDPAGFVPAYTEGWFDGFGALRTVPTAAASFDLLCAGCLATGHALEGSGAAFALAPITSRGALERRVGCEACHGPGSEHTSRPDIARLTIFQPGRAAPTDRLETCARCHERVVADDHPFAVDPAWPVDAAGDSIRADALLADFATPAPNWWAAVPASRGLGDQVGELRGSPHRGGPGGYDGACEDCHDPHGSDRRASLRREPWDNGLCVSCHASRFPDVTAQRTHAAHSTFAPGPWGPGTCTGCHMPRSGLDVRLDAVSTTGELHSHALVPFHPDDVLVEFDLAGEDHLLAGEVPAGGCLDCHHQVDALRRETGGACACPQGDPLYRVTWENLGTVYDDRWGAP